MSTLIERFSDTKVIQCSGKGKSPKKFLGYHLAQLLLYLPHLRFFLRLGNETELGHVPQVSETPGFSILIFF